MNQSIRVANIIYSLEGNKSIINRDKIQNLLLQYKDGITSMFLNEILESEGLNLEKSYITMYIKSSGNYMSIYDPKFIDYQNEYQQYDILELYIIKNNDEVILQQQQIQQDQQQNQQDKLKFVVSKVMNQEIANNAVKEILTSIRKELEISIRREIELSLRKEFEDKFHLEIENMKNQIHKLQKILPRPVGNSKFDNKSIKPMIDTITPTANIIKPPNSPQHINQHSIIDLAVMFAEPLIYKDPETMLRIGLNPVHYEAECYKILETLAKKKKKIEIEFEIANYENLLTMISKGVTALHISCHGDYCKTKNDFYLAFEKKNGELHKVFSSDLQNLFMKKKTNLRLVFVSACHSEMIGNVFKEAGVPCVIAINSNQRINDEVAQHFSQIFYDRLFSDYTITEAFTIAKDLTRVHFGESVIYSCCCSHKHTQDCPWFLKAKELQNSHLAHFLHVPRCVCVNRNQNIHDQLCSWASDFCEKYQLEELMFTKAEEHTCCCTDEPCHNELEKFKMLCSKGDPKLFSEKPDGRILDKNAFKAIDRKFNIQKVYGLNQEIYELFDHLVNREWRAIDLAGSSGVGKTTIAKQFGNYVLEREYFDNVCLLDMSRTHTSKRFIAQLCSNFSPSHDLKSLIRLIKYLKVLFILDNSDGLDTAQKDESKEKFYSVIQRIIDEVRGARFLFITSTNVELGGGVGWVGLNPTSNDYISMKKIHIKELEHNVAAQLLYERSSLALIRQSLFWTDLENHDIFHYIRRTPRELIALSEQLNKTDKTLNQIAAEIKKNQENPNTKVINLPPKDSEQVEFLGLLCPFSSGLTDRDLNYINICFPDVFLKNPWKKIMMSIIDNGSANIGNNDITHGQHTFFDIEEIKIIKKISLKFILNEQSMELIRATYPDMIYKYDVLKIKYLAVMSVAILECFKTLKPELVDNSGELSAFCSYGHWEDMLHHPTILELKEIIINRLSKFDQVHLRAFYNAHEENLISCIDDERIQKLISTDESIFDYFSIISIALTSILFKISSKIAFAMDLAKQAINIADQIVRNDIKFEFRAKKLIIKLKLFRITAYVLLRKRIAASKYHKNIEEKSQKIKEKIKELEVLPEAQLEAYCFKTELIYFQCYSNYKLKKLLPKLSMKKNIKTLEENIIIHGITNSYILKGRILNLKIELCLKFKDHISENDASTLRKIIEEIETIGNTKSQILKMKMSYLYGKLRLLMAQRLSKELEKNNEVSTSTKFKTKKKKLGYSINDITNELEKIKQEYLLNRCLKIVKETKYRNYNKKINDLIDEINLEIKKKCFNLFIMIRANPLIKLNDQSMKMESYDEYDIRNLSTFKTNILKSLSHTNKPLFVRFEILTLKNLRDCFTNGCRALYLKCTCEKNAIIIEDKLGQAQRLSFVDLKNIFYNLPINHSARHKTTLIRNNTGNTKNNNHNHNHNHNNVADTTVNTRNNMSSSSVVRETYHCHFKNNINYLDIVIIGSNDSEIFAKFLENELLIPHIIYFKFHVEDEGKLEKKILNNKLVQIYEEKFCEFFCVELVNNQTILTAFENAKNKVNEHFAIDFFGQKNEEYFGEGAILFSRGSIKHQTKKLFSGPFELKEGLIVDITQEKDPSNIPEPSLPLVGRNVKLYEIIHELQKNKFVELKGPNGIGKTSLAINAGYYCVIKNLYPDGVYYMPCNAFIEQSEIKSFLLGIFGLSVDNNLERTFTGKNMLFIFDEFDEYELRKLPFMIYLFNTLKRLNIPILMAKRDLNEKKEIISTALSTKVIKKYDMEDFVKIHINPMTKEEIALMLATYTKNKLGDFEAFFKKIMDLNCKHVASGIPGCVLHDFEPLILMKYLKSLSKEVYSKTLIEREEIKFAPGINIPANDSEYGIFVNDFPIIPRKSASFIGTSIMPNRFVINMATRRYSSRNKPFRKDTPDHICSNNSNPQKLVENDPNQNNNNHHKDSNNMANTHNNNTNTPNKDTNNDDNHENNDNKTTDSEDTVYSSHKHPHQYSHSENHYNNEKHKDNISNVNSHHSKHHSFQDLHNKFNHGSISMLVSDFSIVEKGEYANSDFETSLIFDRSIGDIEESNTSHNEDSLLVNSPRTTSALT